RSSAFPYTTLFRSDLRQVAEVIETEALEELARRAVHERTADHLLASDRLDQFPLDERREHAVAAADAADLRNLGGRHRLLVRDHRERLERLHRQLLRRPLVEQLADPLVQLRTRDDLIAAGDLHELQAAGTIVVGADRGERRLDVFPGLAVEQLAQRLERQRLGGREDERLD